MGVGWKKKHRGNGKIGSKRRRLRRRIRREKKAK